MPWRLEKLCTLLQGLLQHTPGPFWSALGTALLATLAWGFVRLSSKLRANRRRLRRQELAGLLFPQEATSLDKGRATPRGTWPEDATVARLLIQGHGRIIGCVDSLLDGRPDRRAIEYLARISPDLPTAALILLVTRGRGRRRTNARGLELLRGLGDPNAVKYLWRALRLKSNPAWPDRGVTDILAQLGPLGRRGLIAGLSSPEPEYRLWSLRCAGTLAVPELVEAVAGCLGDPSSEHRLAALDALHKCVGGEEVRGVAERLEELVRGDPDWFVRLRAIDVLEGLAGSAADYALTRLLINPPLYPPSFSCPGLVPPAAGELEFREPAARLTAALARAVDGRGLTASAMRSLESSGERAEQARQFLFAYVTRFCGSSGLLPYYPALSASGRSAVLPILAAAPDDGWRQACQMALGDSDPRVRLAAVRCLALRGIPGHAWVLRDLVCDPDPEVRLEVVRAIGHSGIAELADALLQALRDGTPEVRKTAGAALSRLFAETQAGEEQ